MYVKDLMTTHLITLQPEHRLYQAMEVMKTFKLRHIPIVTEEGKIVGIVSDRDIKKHSSPAFGTRSETVQDRVLMTKEVHQIMSQEIVHVAPDDQLQSAIEKMRQEQLSSVMVLAQDSRQLKGILTDTDLVNCLHEVLKEQESAQTTPLQYTA